MGMLKVDSSKDSSIAVYVTLPVIVKLFQLLLGLACLGIALHDMVSNFQDLLDRTILVVSDHTTGGLWSNLYYYFGPVKNLDHKLVDQLTCRIVFLVVMGIVFLISSIQFTWFAESLVSGSIKSRIISGVIYHLAGFGLQLVATLFLLMKIDTLGHYFFNFWWMRIAVNIAFVNAAMYLLSALLALFTLMEKRVPQNTSSSLPFSKLSGQ